jgi:hypothetical protein
MMERVGGMKINENGSLPPGFNDSDFIDLEKFVGSPTLEEDIEGVGLQPANVKTIIDKRMGSAPRDREDPYIHKKTIDIVDMNGKAIDENRLAKEFTQRPLTLLGTNEKVGKTGILKISLPAYKGLFFDEKNKEFKIVDTCPNAGNCKAYCFQQKGRSVMYNDAAMSKSRILNFLLNHWDDFKYKVIDEIETAKYKNEKMGIETIMRWHDSGDFISDKYLELAMEIARKTPDVLHYAYTKMVSSAKAANVPSNFIFRYSIDSGSPETHLIDKLKDKHADVVPREIFKNYIEVIKEPILNKKGVQVVKNGVPEYKNIYRYKSNEALNQLKDLISKFYDIDRNSIITSDEMNKIPNEGVNKWNVIVTPSDPDTAAHRQDVLGVYLLIH